MRPIHIIVLTLCLLITILDGFDLQAIAFTSTRIMAEWTLAPGAMGLIFSAGLLGVGLGSFVLSPFADRFGRRPTLLAGLAVITIGMLAVWTTTTAAQLTTLRFVTGLGIGLLLPSQNTIVAEYTPERWQTLGVSLYATGYPIGGALSGAFAPYLIEHFGWRSVYLFGGAASAILLPAVAAWLPEPPEFLLMQKPRAALNPLAPFKTPLTQRTVLISAAFFLLWVTSFFITNWTPAILARAGLGPGASAAGGVMLTLGGAAGTVLIGVFALRFALMRVCVVYLSGSFVMALVFGLDGSNVSMNLVCAVLGFLLIGAAVGLYAVVARIFPLEIRATGTGVALAFGRAGAVVGLSVGGFLIGLDWSRASYVSVLAVPVLIAAVATYALGPFLTTANGRS